MTDFLPFKKGSLTATEVSAGSYPATPSKTKASKDTLDGAADQGMAIVDEGAGKKKANAALNVSADINPVATPEGK